MTGMGEKAALAPDLGSTLDSTPSTRVVSVSSSRNWQPTIRKQI